MIRKRREDEDRNALGGVRHVTGVGLIHTYGLANCRIVHAHIAKNCQG
jgi:hypothetical protein